LIVSIIVALDERGGIGTQNRLPWRLSADLQRFKALTMGHHLVVGRKTFESIGKPLPGRQMIVVTRNRAFQAEGCLVVQSLDEALTAARLAEESEAFIAGGAEIYRLALPVADRLYLTRVHAEVDADVFFPDLDPHQWSDRELGAHPADEKNQYPITFHLLERLKQ